MAVQPDNLAAKEFLSQWSPEGPWVLTAIQPNTGKVTTSTFRKEDDRQLDEWLAKFNGGWNLYFHVNPTNKDLTTKAKKEDIAELTWLHVDVDPSKFTPDKSLSPANQRLAMRDHLKAERDRILQIFTKKLPTGVPKPTALIYSGGGLQAFWKLKEPVPINGDIERAEHAERYNRKLEEVFGGDHCHNIDRIMRLPGTVNVPDKKKREAGRVEALARTVYFNGAEYGLDTFKMAKPKQEKLAAAEVNLDKSKIRVIEDLSELDEWDVPMRTRVIVAQGRALEETKEGDDSRSAWLFDAVCNLVRCEVPDEIIYSLITDPGFKISESVTENKNPDRYATRQIKNAHEFVAQDEVKAKEAAEEAGLDVAELDSKGKDPTTPKGWTRHFNERFAVIGNIGGRCRVIEEVYDPAMRRKKLVRQSFEDFRNRFRHKTVWIEPTEPDKPPKPVKAGHWWLDNPQRREYERLEFAPGENLPGVYNLWQGFGVEPKEGDCSLYLQHLRENVCDGNEEYAEYLLNWMAYAVQFPARPGEVAVVFQGDQGTGKGTVAKYFARVWGRHAMHISNSAHLVGNFNAHLQDCIFLFADEAFYAGDVKHKSILKTIVTEDTLAIEAKGVDVTESPNYIHLMMASNDLHVIPAEGGERRFFVLKVANHQKQNEKYFRPIIKQMEEEGGIEALLDFLLKRDISNFSVRDFPRTEALAEQKMLSLRAEEDWWFNKLMDGSVLKHQSDWKREVLKEGLHKDFQEHTRAYHVAKRGSQTALGRFLSRMCPPLPNGRSSLEAKQRWIDIEAYDDKGFTQQVKTRKWFYILPPLADLRAHWDAIMGTSTDWPEEPTTGALDAASGDDPVPF